MIDRLFTLHVRRFGFRVITYLESYTMFVGATINLLDLKEGDAETAAAASARLEFSMEVLRNATSTPSSARCVNIINHLLRKDNDPAVTTAPSYSLRNHSAKPNQYQLGIEGTQPHKTSGQVAFPPRTVRSENDTSLDAETHYDGLASARQVQYQEFMSDGNHMNTSSMAPPTSFHVNPFPHIEAPLRWLPENVQDDCGWMLMQPDLLPYGNEAFLMDCANRT